MAALRTKYMTSLALRLSSNVRYKSHSLTPIIQVQKNKITSRKEVCNLPHHHHHNCSLFSTSNQLSRSSYNSDDEDSVKEEDDEVEEIVDMIDGVRINRKRRVVKDIPYEISMQYINSQSYKDTYGDNLVWKLYRRNYPGGFPPETRKRCIRNAKISTGSPCPICRDDYLVVNYRNVELLQQFLCPHTGMMLSTQRTGVCKRAQLYLNVAIERAMQEGLLVHDVPSREYQYSDFYPAELLEKEYKHNLSTTQQ